MGEYLEKMEAYVHEHYKPEDLTRCKLDELYKMADIMKDLAEYMKHKEEFEIG